MRLKVAIVLFNLGGPDSLSAVRPFLNNLFSDRAIINLPQPFRSLLAYYISTKRANKAKEIYKKIGGRSPILEETNKQARALEEELESRAVDMSGSEYRVFTCMRYWNPMSEEVVKAVKDWDPDHVVLLPLYPQFSTTTSDSSYKEWVRVCQLRWPDCPDETFVCCYPTNQGFVSAYAELAIKLYDEAKIAIKKSGARGVKPRLLFSAHGLPKKVIKSGDPYQLQVEQSARAIIDIMGLETADYRVCYQSKVGPLQWLEPSTESEIVQAGIDGVPVVLVPISFVSEHSETLVELDMDYKELAEKHNVTGYYRVPAVSTHPLFIKGLADLIQLPESDKVKCPDTCSKCPCIAYPASIA